MTTVSVLAGVLVAVCLISSGKAGELDDCLDIQSCMKYSETGCNSAGQRTVCLRWVDLPECVLDPAGDAIDFVCKQNDIGSFVNVPCQAASIPATPLNGMQMPAVPAGTMAVGTTVQYVCNAGFQLSTSTTTPPETTQFVTCKNDGGFTALSATCISINPTSCQDYFQRGTNFADLAPGACTEVDLEVALGVIVATDCCRGTAANSFSTQLTATPTTLPPATCGVVAASTITTNADGVVSAFCGPPIAIDYSGKSDADIQALIATHPGGCTQTTTIGCTGDAPNTAAVIQVFNRVGFQYGTNTFTVKSPTASPTISMAGDVYAHTGAACDCALGNNVVPPSTCQDGCHCTIETIAGTSIAAGTDTVTKHLTAGSPDFVKNVQMATHNTQHGIASSDFTITVGDIVCPGTM